MKTTYVFGAGADAGIFPLTHYLIPAINSFLENDEDGKAVNALLRKKLLFRSYSYTSILEDAAYTFVHKKDPNTIALLRTRLTSTLEKRVLTPLTQKEADEKQQALTVLDKLTSTACSTTTGREKQTREQKKQIQHLCQKQILAFLKDFLIDTKDRVLHAIFKTLVNFDAILLELFLGLYNGNHTDIRRYLYLSWSMWAFFVCTEERYIWKKNEKTPSCLYECLGDGDLVTLNYTTLAATFMHAKNAIHFHGSVITYIDCLSRGELPIDTFAGYTSISQAVEKARADGTRLSIPKILENDILSKMSIHRVKDSASNRYVIPSMMPPFEIKPIIANDLIVTWYHAMQLMEQSDRIIAIGYSFNHTDAHFNDIILMWANEKNENGQYKKMIYIVNPDEDGIKAFFDSIVKLKEWKNTEWKKIAVPEINLQGLQKSNIVIIPAKASDVVHAKKTQTTIL